MSKEKDDKTTDFGYKKIPIEEKVNRVKGVFSSVASKYDVMNDLMSIGIHRIWKRFAINLLDIRSGQTILDLAGGTGDLTKRIYQSLQLTDEAGIDKGKIILSDINWEMLTTGKNRLMDDGIEQDIDFVLSDAQALPFKDNMFDRIIIGFGLRNVTDKQKALESMARCLKPGGKLIILEFSKPTSNALQKIYDVYSFNVLPKLGKVVARDADSYQYLAESIRMHPDQDNLKAMMEAAGLENCDYHNLSGGIVAVHRGYKA